jgi:TPP-dependent trihydroxycyclohexane-1,2-dione (THcHDO) dehydratase
MDEYLPKDYKVKDFNINNILTKALNNDNNDKIINLTKQKISKYKNDALQQLQLPRLKLKEINKKLKEYRYISDLSEINYGSYIRWINLNNIDNIKLTNGGIILDMKMTNKGIIIICKNNMNRNFGIYFDECLIFQKLSDQENVLLEVIDYINK